MRWFGQVLAGCALVGLFRASHEWMFSAFSDAHIPLQQLVVPYLLISVSWAVLTAVVFGVVYRIPMGRLDSWRTLLTIFVPMIVMVAATAVVGEHLSYQISQSTRAALTSRFFMHEFHPALFDAFIILGIACAIRIRDDAAERALRTERLESQLGQAQIRALRSQLQPHFLFNALHSISAVVYDAPEKAEVMIARLADLLRMSIDSAHDQFVPLRSEIAFVSRYLDVQQARFGEQLRVCWNLDVTTLGLPVPNFILQPLLENCFKHGIGQSPGPYTIRLVTALEDASLVLRIEEEHGAGGALPAGPVGDGVGLANLRARLHALYGGSASLDVRIRHENGGGSVAIVRLPPGALAVADDPHSSAA
ncbi:MAG: histidine kinase [Acidobacteria bacterium]|nr:histidine kinase [Acidobacteriota bacterium]